MSYLTSALFIVIFVLTSPQLAACAERNSYHVTDSSLLVRDNGGVVWLDNSRVLFGGYTGVEYSADNPNRILRYRDEGYYVWDTTKGTTHRDTSFDDKANICVHGEYWSYVRLANDSEKTPTLVSGDKGEETERPFPKLHWFNPHSCRYYESKPFWVVNGHKTLPLLEEHGYLDLGGQPELNLSLREDNLNSAISFYSIQAKQSFPLPIGQLEVRVPEIEYVPYKNAYLISGLQYFDAAKGLLQPAWPDDVPLTVWWLSLDGTAHKEETANAPWMHGNSFSFFSTRVGLFLVKHTPSGRGRVGAMGGYIVEGQSVRNVVEGALRRIAISPDGCNVAVVNDTYLTKPLSERTRVQMIRLCQGE